ncbi:MAG: 50S ribosomal protein L18 [Candidatus Bathyarchaeia archaeon]
MAKGPGYRVPYRRRREFKTDYRKRRILATSKYPRFVVRITNKNIIIQIIKAEVKGDHSLIQAHSKELVEKFNWKGDPNNTSAAYLLGLIAGLKALRAEIEATIPDIGLRTPSKGSRVFAAIKGARDAGLKIPLDEAMAPGEDRITGSHVAAYGSLLKEKPEVYERLFSKYLRRGLKPEDIPEHFEEVKNRIMEVLGVG